MNLIKTYKKTSMLIQSDLSLALLSKRADKTKTVVYSFDPKTYAGIQLNIDDYLETIEGIAIEEQPTFEFELPIGSFPIGKMAVVLVKNLFPSPTAESHEPIAKNFADGSSGNRRFNFFQTLKGVKSNLIERNNFYETHIFTDAIPYFNEATAEAYYSDGNSGILTIPFVWCGSTIGWKSIMRY